MALQTYRFTQCFVECDKCQNGEVVNTGDMGTRTIEDIKKYWRSNGWRIEKRRFVLYAIIKIRWYWNDRQTNIAGQ